VVPAHSQELDAVHAPHGVVLAGMSRAAQGLDLQLTVLAHDPAEDLAVPAGPDPTGIALLAQLPTAQVARLAAAYPVASLVHDYPGVDGIDVVGADDFHGIGQLVDHHRAFGHQRVGFLDWQGDGNWQQERLGACAGALTRHGLGFDPRCAIRWQGVNQPTESDAHALRRALELGVTAWVCANDLMALMLYEHLRTQGIAVPGEVSITGFDGVEPLPGMPRLTTIRPAAESIGYTLLRCLRSRAEQPTQPGRRVLFRGQLIEGETTGPVAVPAAAAPVARPRVAIVSELDVLNPCMGSYYPNLLWALRTHLRRHGVDADLYMGETQPADAYPVRTTCRRFVSDLDAGRLDGVIALDFDWRQDWLPAARTAGLPVVGTRPEFDHAVYPDDAGFLREAARRLADQGCRRLGYLGWSTNAADPPGLREAAGAAGLELREEWIRGDLHPDLEGSGWEEFREIWSARERPDGLIVADDVLAVSADKAIRELGIRVPEQLHLAVAGNRGSGIRYSVPVTLLELDTPDYAVQLGDMLLRLLKHEPVPEPIITIPYRFASQPSSRRGAGGRVVFEREFAERGA
jgi:DNA-binding LacI/PurR family transcriptional regulator